MGLRSPQEMATVKLRQEGTTRFQGAVAPKIDTTFLSTASKGIAAQEAAQTKLEEEQFKFISADADNVNEEARLKAQGELALTKGLDSLDASEKLEKKLIDASDKNIQKYPAKYQQLLKIKSDKTLNKYRTFKYPYVAGQANEVKDKTYDAQIANSVNSTIEVSGDPEAFQANLDEVAFRTSEQVKRKYGDSPDLSAHLIEKSVSETVRRSVEAQAKSGNILIASRIATEHNSKLTPNDRNKVNAVFKAAQQDDETRVPLDRADMIMRETGGDLAAAEAMNRETAPDFKTYTKTRDVIRSQIKMEKEGQDRADQKTISNLTGKVDRGQMPSSYEMNQIKDFEARQKFADAINKNKGALGTVTDQGIKESLLTKLSNATPEEAADIDITHAKLSLGASDYTTLERLKIDLSKKDAFGRTKARQSDFRQVRSMIVQLGKGLPKKKRVELEQLAMDEYERVRDTNANYKIEDIKKSVYNRVKREGIVVTEKSTWFGLSSDKVTTIAESVDPLEGTVVHKSWRNYLDSLKEGTLNEEQKNKILIKLKSIHGEKALGLPFAIK